MYNNKRIGTLIALPIPMNKHHTRREKFNTSTLQVYLHPGLRLSIKAEGYMAKKARRTALLLVLKALKKEVRFMTKANLFHNDSSILRGFFDSITPASLYQATDIETKEQKFGHRLRSMRTGLSLSQKELALLVGIQRTYLCRIERGQHRLNEYAKARIMNILYSLYIGKPIYELPPLRESPPQIEPSDQLIAAQPVYH